MSRRTNPLKHVRVAAPCPADWESMTGDERVRFCGQCNLHVYNLSEMTRREAERLITETEGRLCVRFYRRADGTILTDNCPVGLSAMRRRLSRVAGAVISTIISFFAGVGSYAALREGGQLTSPTQGEVVGVMVSEPPPLNQPLRSEVLMGDIYVPEFEQSPPARTARRTRPRAR